MARSFFRSVHCSKGFLRISISTSECNRRNHPQKCQYPSLGGSGHDLPSAEEWKARRHNCRHPIRKKNRVEGQSAQIWKAAKRNPISHGDVTYESSISHGSCRQRLRIETSKARLFLSPHPQVSSPNYRPNLSLYGNRSLSA